VAAFAFVLIGLAVWRFQTLIGPVVMAGMIAYFLDPVIVWLERRTHLSRGAVIGLVYPVFALMVLGVLFAAGVSIVTQALSLIRVLQEIFWATPEYLAYLSDQPIQFGPWTLDPHQLNLDLLQVFQQAFTAIQPLMSQSAQLIGLAASTTMSWVGWAILIFVLSIYFAIDWPRFYGLISDAIYQPGYRRDVEHLLEEAGRIWNGYLRGRTALAVIVAITFTIILNLLGVRYAIVLGILAGILDFIPYFGPIVAVAISTAVAVFQGSNWLGINPIWFGLIVLLVGLLIQQIEGNWLIPRIVGNALGLHPLLVLVGAIMGGILGGVMGMILAAPVLATIKLLGSYGWRKMFDLDPFPEEEGEEPEPVSERVEAVDALTLEPAPPNRKPLG
jgi:predicted PurR-regulated permease PerM